ncbi:ABC transporter ATP-binding protein [Zafaria cholistanensis]|uniref:ABC transporter ATP-binding protein n=1 Tax=Zafaria cholistanensis TaxID=1682741 RepID=A0A5A7NT77_9MICC|nr:ABC transporter ATP-binding protein [Zafaria cholistanensis]GER23018.1 ABC transporter ATP-binding protein [Zafaria cholistanensis]
MPEGLLIEQLRLSEGTPSTAPARTRADRSAPAPRTLLAGVDLTVAPGEFVALVGASGSGKTLTAMSALGLLPPNLRIDSGTIRLGGTDLRAAGEAELNRVRGGRIGMLFQQPKRMFNPRQTIISHLLEPLRLHAGLRGREARARAVDLLAEAGLSDPGHWARAYPHQLSGGMAQRAMLAVALAGQPELLLADEPTSALDKVLERQILELIDRQRRQRGLGILYITHDFATVSAFADRVVVMEAGQVKESGPAAAVLDAPQSECTRQLLASSALVPGPKPAPAASARTVLALEGVTKRFAAAKRGLRPALEQVSLTVLEGEILGVLGQSGSGKSTLARLAVGLESPDSGRITRPTGARQGPGGSAGTAVQLVFQEPHDAFDPRMRLCASLEAPLAQRGGLTTEERQNRIHRVLQEVELEPGLLDRYPGQCSGGQLQRLTIARALLLEPTVLICDEATSALDAVTQRKVLDLLLRLQRDHRMSLVMISHDMNVIRYASQRVAVLFEGALVELAATEDFFTDPQHPHSRQLVAASLPSRRAGTTGPQRLVPETQELLDALPPLPA